MQTSYKATGVLAACAAGAAVTSVLGNGSFWGSCSLRPFDSASDALSWPRAGISLCVEAIHGGAKGLEKPEDFLSHLRAIVKDTHPDAEISLDHPYDQRPSRFRIILQE